jgi:hypothetical protein
MSLAATALVCATLLTASAGVGEGRGHRGSVGLLVDGILDARASVGGDGRAADNGVKPGLGVGGTWALDDRLEVKLSGRLFPTAASLFAVSGGLRNGYQLERWRTFVDLELAAYLGRLWSLGPRLGLGVEYELHPLVGISVALGTHFGLGSGARFLGECVVGVHLRSYLFE